MELDKKAIRFSHISSYLYITLKEDLSVFHYCELVQKDFDSVWCRGTVKEMIFEPWMNSLKKLGCKFLEGRRVTEFFLNEETNCISGVGCGKESLEADAVILAVGISTMQDIIQNRFVVHFPVNPTFHF